jgi:predicted nucleic acid-binding protein
MILADTGFWVALANRHDRHHAVAVARLGSLREKLVTTWPVLTETCHLLMRFGVDAELRFIRSTERGAVELFDVGRPHLARIEKLMDRYRDLPMDLADASLVIAAEDLGSGRILSTDERDFRAYRWKNTKPFTNVLLQDGG